MSTFEDKIKPTETNNAEIELQRLSNEKLQSQLAGIVKQAESPNLAETNVEGQIETQQELSDIEKKAMEMGWDPNHQGRHFIPADEYVRRAPLFERIERQSKELRELKELQQQTLSHISLVRKEAYERAIKDLETQKLLAVQEGDTTKYTNAESQAKTIAYQMQTDPILNRPPPQPTIANEVQDFAQKHQNNWYNENTTENAKMKAAADSVDRFLTKQAQIDQGLTSDQMPVLNLKEHLRTIESEVKRLYPHRFENVARNQPASVARSTANGTSNTIQTDLVSRLTPSQRELGLRFQLSNKDYTLEKYAADLDAAGRLRK